MDCRTFEDRLDAFVAGSLQPETMAAVTEHLHACPRCRTLVSIIRGEKDARFHELPNDLLPSILRRTAGPPCPQAEERLCDAIDGSLSIEDGDLLASHLNHCTDCSRLASVLAECQDMLPEMALLEPDAGFVDDVLCVTARRIKPYSAITNFHQLSGWWHRLVRRPRFAFEVAYLGSLVFLLALGSSKISSQLSPWAIDLPGIWQQSADRIFQETADTLADRRDAARKSLSVLLAKGQNLLEAAADIPDQTVTSFRQKAVMLFQEIKSDSVWPPDPDSQKRNQPSSPKENEKM